MISLLIYYVWTSVQLIIGYNLIFPLVLFGIAAMKKKVLRNDRTVREADYAIIVTAYEQTDHLASVIESILKLKYEDFTVYVVADNCDISGLHFKDHRINILRPEEPLRSNVKSHFYAIRKFQKNHERLTIIDSDNLVEPEYLNELNYYFETGYLAVQGSRLPKNLNTAYASLDAARDIYYHFYDGKILFELGSSATLAGSGMAFQTDLYVACMEIHSNLQGAGFDKVLQAEIVVRDQRIAFAEKAIVYDEKTSHPEQLVSQRARWIHTWFRYFKYGFKILKNGLLTGSLNQFLFGLVLLRPPLFMFLISSLLCGLVDLFIRPMYVVYWCAGFLLFIIGFFIALLKSKTNRQIYKSLCNIPLFIYYQIVAALRSGNQKENIATRHTDSVENIST